MGSWIDAVTTFLFKYPPRAFARGDLVTAPMLPAWLLVALALVLGGLVLAMHFSMHSLKPRDRLVLASLRVGALLLILACLLRPGLVIASAVPQRNVLAVLYDDSRSMRIRDVGAGGGAADGAAGATAGIAAGSPTNTASRMESVQKTFADSSDLIRSLGEKFALRQFRFSGSAAPLRSSGELLAGGTRSDLAQALDDVREDMSGMPLAGIILVSDGADNAQGDFDDVLLALRARRVPVYTVGVGRERFERDIGIERVEAPKRTLSGASSVIAVDVRLRGVGKDPVAITVEADGRVVATETVSAPARGDLSSIEVRVPPLEPGVHRLAVKARPLPNETVTENNEYQTSLTVRPGPDRVLYVEGEPRPEFAFLRRAVADDSALVVVGLMRSAERKYLRLGVRDSMELLGGFPTSREELFQYRAIILGSVEAGFFSADQLRMLADFVSLRGGGLLVLGGRASLSEGGFTGTPLADVLPLTLSRRDINTEDPAITVRLRPTRTGESHPALQLGETPRASARLWDSLPELTMVNEPGTPRAGATVLVAGQTDDGRSDIPILSYQRYGRGMSAIFGVQDSWRWRMDTSIPVDDHTHQTLWRQIVRWLVEDAPAPFQIAASPARVAPGEPVQLRAQVNTSLYAEVNNADVVATVTGPDGRVETVPLEWSLREDGNYTARFTPADTGRYTISAEARRSGAGSDSVQRSEATLLVDERGADVAQAELRSALLQRIANQTGGRYYTLQDAARIASDAVYTDAGVTVREAHDLWDMPAVLLALLLLLGGEWGYRRRRGLI